MKDLYKAISSFEENFEERFNLSLNEAMILCAIHEANEALTSTAISDITEISPSNTSKLLGAIEDKKLIVRALGKTDKRQMYFHLTKTGSQYVDKLQSEELVIPDLLKPLF